MEKNTQLPVEVEAQITKEAEAHNTRLKEHAESEKDEAYAQGFAEGWGEGATAYAPWKVKYDELCERFKEQDQAMFALQQELSQLKAQPAPRWVKGTKGFPVMKRVVAKFKHYDDPLRDWVVGYASSSTGETITFDWGVSSITLDINHERWDLLYWLDEQPAAGREEDAVAFAEWIRESGIEPTFGNKWVDFSKPKDNRHTTAELYQLFKQHNP